MRFKLWSPACVLLCAGMWLMLPCSAAATTSPNPASPGTVTMWCDPNVVASYAQGPPDVAAVYHAEDALCRGDYARARDLFAAIVPYWRKRQSNDRYWIQTARGYFYSLIATHQDSTARAFLTGLENDDKWEAGDGDRLFWHGQPKIAFMAYAAEAGTVSGMPGDPKDKNLDDAAQASDMNAAIAVLQKPSGTYGPGDVGSLQLLMLGEAYATLGRWSDAFATWVRAADSGHAVPEFDTFDNYNLSALEMIYYYRAHMPAD